MYILFIRDHTNNFDIGVESGPMLDVAIAMLHLDLSIIRSAHVAVVHQTRATNVPIHDRARTIWSWTNMQNQSEFYSFLRDTHGYTWCCRQECFKDLRQCPFPIRFERHLYTLTLEQYESDYDENNFNAVD